MSKSAPKATPTPAPTSSSPAPPATVNPVPVGEEDALAEERLVLKTAALTLVVRRYLELAEALSSSDSTEIDKKAAAFEAKLTEFERGAARLEGLVASETSDINAALEASTAATERMKQVENALAELQHKMEQEHAAERSKQDAKRLAAELAKLPRVEALNSELASIQQEVEQAKARCNKLERRLRTRQQQFAPLSNAAKKLHEVISDDNDSATMDDDNNNASVATQAAAETETVTGGDDDDDEQQQVNDEMKDDTM